MTRTDSIIQTNALCKEYSETVTAIHDVNISIGKGEFVSLIGRSGSGKSTLMNIIGGLDYPTSGDVLLHGTPVNYRDRATLIRIRRNCIGFVFQQFNLLPNLTAQENVEYPLIFNYHEKAERKKRAAALLDLVGLSDRATHYPRQLSGGEQQRVSIARALIGNPEVVLADEPTGNLDSRTSDEIFRLLRELNAERQTTFFIVTHDRALGAMTDRRIELLDGRVIG
jgi:putative ABC transport system ATP-binding protein